MQTREGLPQEKIISCSERNVEKSDYAASKFHQPGGSGVPLITVGSQIMKGFVPGRFMEMWQAGQAAS